MKRFSPAFLAILLVSGSVLALSQNADASPSNSERDKWRERVVHIENKRRHRSYLQDHCATALSIFNCVSLYNFKH
ncbi:hypothetical protein G7B40_013060 [Aetokthonos hydrillicola Thurmond2011]|jgi:hypothetical protein|uniref:Secreted protein n=1 Tax=Aetokthonos hydrillicola Thurmond2011 TaxID=2712845 RepID=A0AAP5MAE3_9CYAN|nr:hypothetical protein [Aetokthonos hydrillicola]MBO3459453.1 hypothetical protein [Aetokthonos hydrillicola CCALA 1050]MBW4583816.1 hypothetical protein [Aetokthonos hydrillicola CCALA 1050]MDR9895489.1 hypothetical protein [Aetokthonos hydrillicola Thurmond2011]